MVRDCRRDAVEKVFFVEPRSGGILLATGVSRWRTGLQTISAVGAAVWIGIGAMVTHRPLPHHRAYGSVHGGSKKLKLTLLEQRRKSASAKVRVRKRNGQ